MVETEPVLPGIDPESLKTAQELDTGGAVPGVGPASPAQASPGPAETIEEQGIGPKTPYPDGNPPEPPNLHPPGDYPPASEA